MTDPVFQGQTFTEAQFEGMGHVEQLAADGVNDYPAQPRFMRLWWNIVRAAQSAAASATNLTAALLATEGFRDEAEGFKDDAEAAAAAAATFNPDLYVEKAGSTMSGPLAVPEGATGNQVMRASEVAAAIQAAIDALIGGAPGALDTLNEIAEALNDDEDFAASVTVALGGKQPLAAILTAITSAGAVTESEITLADVTTGNATTSQHGFLKKLSNVAGQFMNGVGNWVQVTYANIASGQIPSGVGLIATSGSGGTVTTGTVTFDPQSVGNFVHYTNNGAHTLAPPAGVCTMSVEITNGASAGAITTSGFTKVYGDAFTTTNTHRFQCIIHKSQNSSSLTVRSMQ